MTAEIPAHCESLFVGRGLMNFFMRKQGGGFPTAHTHTHTHTHTHMERGTNLFSQRNSIAVERPHNGGPRPVSQTSRVATVREQTCECRSYHTTHAMNCKVVQGVIHFGVFLNEVERWPNKQHGDKTEEERPHRGHCGRRGEGGVSV